MTTRFRPLPPRARRGAPAAPLLACLLLSLVCTAARAADRAPERAVDRGAEALSGSHVPAAAGNRLADARRTGDAALAAGTGWTAPAAPDRAIVRSAVDAVAGARGAPDPDAGAHPPPARRPTLDLRAADAHAGETGGAGWRWRDMRAGLARGLEDHWRLSMNVTRAVGNSNPADRCERCMPGAGGTAPGGNLARRALVVSLGRSF